MRHPFFWDVPEEWVPHPRCCNTPKSCTSTISKASCLVCYPQHYVACMYVPFYGRHVIQ
jgi:hypothetical protein